jgi:CubicO group peptidase (beta-lactamase class C family)
MTRSLIILLFYVSGAAAQTPAVPDTVDRFIRAELERRRIPGMSVAVLRGDSVLLARGYGFANLEHHVPATDSTVYAVGSLSKQFTAAAIVLLSQQGRLGLDDPITRYLPEGSAVWSRVTIRHLRRSTARIRAGSARELQQHRLCTARCHHPSGDRHALG